MLEIFLYGIEEYGLAQAERYKDQIEKTFQTLSDNPRIARLRQEIIPSVRVYPTQKHMIVSTILEDETVYVLRVRHHRENGTEHHIELGLIGRFVCGSTLGKGYSGLIQAGCRRGRQGRIELLSLSSGLIFTER